MIFITGASSGIGLACAKGFASRGKSLFLCARRMERLESLKAELLKLGASRVECVKLDISDRRVVEAFASTHREKLTMIEALINNAGLASGFSIFQDGDPDQWEAMLDTNVRGLIHMTRVLIPGLKKARGHIVNLGSVAGHFAYPKGNVYCASKAAVKMLTECLRLDLLGTGVRVTEISPGMVETEFSLVRLGDPEKARSVYAGMTPLSAQDVAEAILWCVERPAHVNVQELVLYPTDQASPTVVHRASGR